MSGDTSQPERAGVDTSIIVATKDHLDDLVEMAAAFRDLLKRPGPTDSGLRQGILSLIEQENREFFAAYDADGHSLGYVQQRYAYSLWLSGNEARIEDLFVWPERRRTGIASQLIEYAIHRASTRECLGITLETNELNTAAIALYEKYGFASGSTRFENSRELWFTRAI